MKMHHLEEDEVKEVMEKVQVAVKEEELAPDKIEEIFKLSKVASEGFLNCKSNEIQAQQVNFEIEESILKSRNQKVYVSLILLTSTLKESIKIWMDGQFGP